MAIVDVEMQSTTVTKDRYERSTNIPRSEIVVITICDSEPTEKSALMDNSNSYVIKDPYLAQALRNISEKYISTKIATPFSELDSHRVRNYALLSDREEEVLDLVAKGASNKVIAARLFISENTVKTHLRNIMNKLEVENRSQAAVYATRTKLAHKT